MEVATASGRWHVRRQWAPRRLGADTLLARFRSRSRRMRERAGDLADIGDVGCALDGLEALLAVIGVVLVVFFLVVVGIPLLIALGEFLVVVVLALGGVVGRVLFRRPWTIDAVGPNGEHHTWPIVGWGASSRARAFVADRLLATGRPPTAQEVDAAVLAG